MNDKGYRKKLISINRAWKFTKHGSVFFIALFISFALREYINKEVRSKVLPPPVEMRNYSFGFNETLSDLLWLRYLQDSWFCVQDKTCHKDWGYKVLNEASELAPKFKSLYKYGALTVSVALDDDEGAKILFDRGIAEFPTDWDINYRAGYHYLIELNQPLRAAQLFETASENGAPYWTRALSAKLYSESGRLDVSERILADMIEQSINADWKKTLESRLQEVQKKKALQAQSQ